MAKPEIIEVDEATCGCTDCDAVVSTTITAYSC